jgi:uncharacterized repeat protein (TIGR01451 family)
MAGSKAPKRRWASVVALATMVACALTSGGCLNPPPTALAPTGPQLFTPTPGPDLGTSPVAVAPGTPAPGPMASAAPPALIVPPQTLPVIGAPPASPPGVAVVPAQTAPLPAPAPVPAGAPLPDQGVLLAPGLVVAPVNATVVMVAGVYGPGRQMLPGMRVEWSIPPGSVGQITAVGDFHRGLFSRASPAQKLNGAFAVNETFYSSEIVNRGTGQPNDALSVVRGQTWISVSSPNEGDTYVTALAPELGNWGSRQQSAVVHWVDAQWAAPPPAVGAAGTRHTFTTSVTKRSTGEPLAGWRVRYEITGGPAGGFAPDGNRVAEATTNELGQASVEMVEPQPEQGVNPILIQIIRPAGVSGGLQRLVVGNAATEMSWTTPRAALHITGPVQADVGATATYRIEVTNSGAQPATNVVVADPLPTNVAYLRSNPAASVGGTSLEWSLGTLQPGETKAIDLDVRANAGGAINHCVTLRTAEGLTGQDCATTTIRATAVELRLTGPTTATVGSDVRFDLEIINRSEAMVSNLVLTDNFDAGLVHPVSKSPIQREIDPIPPGQSQKVRITFHVAQAGRLCHTVELSGPNGLRQSSQACIDATGDGAAPAGPTSGGDAPPVGGPSNPFAPPGGFGATPTGPGANPISGGTPARPSFTLKVTGPASAHVGDKIEFVYEVKNTGDAPIPSITLTTNILSADRLLQVKEANADFKPTDGQLTCTIANLPAGQSERRRVACQCLAAGPRACDGATATNGGDLTLRDEACVEILPADTAAAPGGKLSVSIATRANPIKVGGDTSLVVTMSNAGPNSERKAALTVKLPDGLQYRQATVNNPTRMNVDGQSIGFEPVVELKVGEPMSFEIPVHATTAGDLVVHAEATSQTQMMPITADASIKVFAEQ